MVKYAITKKGVQPMKNEKFQVKSPILGFDNIHEVSFAEVDDGARLPAHWRVHNPRHFLRVVEHNGRSHPDLGPENILDFLLEPLGSIICADVDQDIVSADIVGADFHHIILHSRDIVENVEQCRRIECSALELYHLLLASHY